RPRNTGRRRCSRWGRAGSSAGRAGRASALDSGDPLFRSGLMGSMRRTWLCSALCALTFFGTQVFTIARETAPAESMIGFGGAVLVGDGEVFAGEAANQ